MKMNITRPAAVLLCLAAFLLPAGPLLGAEITGIGNAAKEDGSRNTSFPAFELPMPKHESEKQYLGLSGTGNFRIGQVKAQALIIEVFSFYCPHCQRMASQVNELFQKIQERPDLKDKIKMIGIGAGNSMYEVDSFKERYHVPFPLFPDQDIQITQMLGVRGTPTFIGVWVSGRENPERFYFGEGGFQDAGRFLNGVLKSSGIERGGDKK